MCVRVVSCAAFILWCAYKVRSMRDGFFIKDELECWGVLILMYTAHVILTAAWLGEGPITNLVTWLIYMLFISTSCLYPVARSYGWDFHPLKPLQWLVSCFRFVERGRGAGGKPRSLNAVEIPLLELLTREEYKVLYSLHTREGYTLSSH